MKNKLFINQWRAGVQNMFWTPICIFIMYRDLLYITEIY